MVFTIAEGDRCKDSQDINVRHVARTVNPQLPMLEDIDEDLPLEVVNPKMLRRNDFKNKRKQIQEYNPGRKCRLPIKAFDFGELANAVPKIEYFPGKKLRLPTKKITWIGENHSNIKPHSSLEGNIFTDLLNTLKGLELEKAASVVEALLTIIALKARESTLERCLIVLAYMIKVHLGESYSKLFSRMWIKAKFSFSNSIRSWDINRLQDFLKQLLQNWTIASKNEAFGSIMALLSTFLAVVYGAEKRLTWTLGSFSLFVVDARNACKGAVNLVDAIIKVVAFVVNGIREYSVNGSYTGFLYSDDQLAAFDMKVSDLKAKFSLIQPGNLERIDGTDENQFDKDLQRTITEGERLVLMYDGNTKKYVLDRLRQLRQIHVDFIQFRAAGGLRMAPFAYVLSGSSGLGKSSLNEILMRYTLSVNGFNHEDAYICTLNSQDKYFSTYRSYINGVIFDDFANANHEFVEESPCDVLLKFVNNVPFYLNMAELELKGKVVAEPKVVGVTTNVSNLQSDVYSNQPSSIMRRMKVHIYAKVKKEFSKEGSVEIDPEKVHARFGTECLAPDIWEFDVMTVKIIAIPRPPKIDVMDSVEHRDDQWKLEYVKWNGKDMHNATLAELLLYIKQASKVHFDSQKALIDRSKLFNGPVVCENCECFKELCICNLHVLSDAASTLSEIREVEAQLEGHGITPHSYSEENKVFVDLIHQRNQKRTYNSFKNMLLANIVNGRGLFDSWITDMSRKVDKEFQFLFAVLQRIVSKYITEYKDLILQLMIPNNLEDSVIGDYLSLVMREPEVSAVVTTTKIVENAFWFYIAFSSAYSLYKGTDTTLNVIISNLALSVMFKPANLVAKAGACVHFCKRKVKKVISDFGYSMHFDSFWLTLLPVTMTPYLTGKCATLLDKYSVMFSKLLPRAFSSFNYKECIMTLLFGLGSLATVSLVSKARDSIIRTYEAPRSVSKLCKSFKAEKGLEVGYMLPGIVTIGSAIYNWDSIVSLYEEAIKTWNMRPQAVLDPSIEEILVRDKKHKFDEDWFKYQVEGYLDPLPTSVLRTSREVRDAIGENVWHVRNVTTNSRSNCFVLCSGFILIPWHYVPKNLNEFEFVRHGRGNQGNRSFRTFIEPGQCERIGNLDLALVWQPKTGDVRNMINYFPLSYHETKDPRTGRVATRNFEGRLSWDDVYELIFTKEAQSGLGFHFNGAAYFWENAAEGKCMSPIITDDAKACISGLHVGGSTRRRHDGKFLCYSVTPTQDELRVAKCKLEAKPTIIPMSDMGDFSETVMGVDVLKRTLKKKSCYLRMEEQNNCRVMGSSNNCNRTPKSQVRSTFICDRVYQIFDVPNKWASPKFKGPDGKSPHKPWEDGMAKWIKDRPGLPFGLLNKAKTCYQNTLTRKLLSNKNFWEEEIKPLSWEQTVNGIPGKRFIEAINFKSSIGFPFKGSKKLYSTDLGDTGEGWQNKRVLDQEFMDEAISIEGLYKQKRRYYPWFTSTLKDEPTPITKDKVRVFQASSTPFQLVVRKYTLPICRFLQLNPLSSESAVGIDPCSGEWHETFMHLKAMQTPCFDRWFAIDYKAYDTSISSQVILAVGRIFIDVAKIIGYSPEDLTILESIFTELAFSVVDFNGDVLILDGANPSGNPLTVFINGLGNSLLMRAFFYDQYPNCNFNDYVRMMSYGDDLIASIRAGVGNFNMVSFAEFGKKFGYEITSADKEKALTHYVSSSQIDFLKRKFVWNDDFKHYIGPLEEASIYKRLCSYMATDTDVELIVGANLDGALDEWTFYGRKVYEEKQEKILSLVQEFHLHRFVYRVHLSYDERVALWLERFADPAVMGKGQSMVTGKLNDDKNFLGFFGWGNIFSVAGNAGPAKSSTQESNSSKDSNGFYRTSENKNKEQQSASAEKVRKVKCVLEEDAFDIFPHSSFSMETRQIMSLIEGTPNQLVDIESVVDPTRKASDATDNSLGGFLSRPIKIHEFNWTPAVTPNVSFDPWQLFLENKRVVNRMNNYKLFRAKLKIKIMINGNSFFYGRLLACYNPLDFYDELSEIEGQEICNVKASQLPHITLDPTTSQGGEMMLPFFWHYDYLDLADTSYQTIGKVYFRQLNSLKHTSGDTSSSCKVAVTTYAWLEDVELTAPTQSNLLQIVPQSTNSNRSQKQQTIMPLEPRAVSNMMLTDSMDNSAKMTVTTDQEVDTQNDIAGLGLIDQMSIKYIASRETWLQKFNWPLSSASGSLLWNCRVDPAQFRTITEDGDIQYSFTASCGAVLPFECWNGTFKLRLQIVASTFHRGRLAIVYDPIRTADTREDNIAYTKIVDISSCRDAVFEVGPNQDLTMLNHAIPGDESESEMHGTEALVQKTYGNGTIAVYVLNELTIPTTTQSINNDIQINAYVSMGDDFEVFIPSAAFSYYEICPQSTVGLENEPLDQVPTSPVDGDLVFDLDTKLQVPRGRDKVFFGEKVDSFSQLLKRYYLLGCELQPAKTYSIETKSFKHRAFPVFKGNFQGTFYYYNTTLLNYLALAYQGWRGSIRYKWIPKSLVTASHEIKTAYVAYAPAITYGRNQNEIKTTSQDLLAYTALNVTNHKAKGSGSLAFVTSVNPVIEYEIPWYSQLRFAPGKRPNQYTSPISRDEAIHGVVVYTDLSTNAWYYDIHVAAGDDFTFYFFTGWPRVIYAPDDPEPE